MANNEATSPSALPDWLSGVQQSEVPGDHATGHVDGDSVVSPIEVDGIDRELHLKQPFILLSLNYATLENPGQEEPSVILSDVALDASVLGESNLDNILAQLKGAVALLEEHREQVVEKK